MSSTLSHEQQKHQQNNQQNNQVIFKRPKNMLWVSKSIFRHRRKKKRVLLKYCLTFWMRFGQDKCKVTTIYLCASGRKKVKEMTLGFP